MTPFAAYAPDQPAYFSGGSPLIRNVIPTASGYKPFPALRVLSETFSGLPLGLFFNIETDGTVTIFAAQATKLFKLNTADYSWDDVGRTSGAYLGNATQGWSFARFGSQIIATNGNDAPQVYTVGSSSNFEDLAGSPPKARYVTVAGDYVMLYGLTDYPSRVWWSGTNDATEWRPGRNNCDYQDFPDGGEVMFVAPVERNAIILQRSKTRAMTATGESGFVFTFSEIESRGAVSHRGCCVQGGRVYYLAEDGFFAVSPGGGSVPIGAERVDSTVRDDLAGQSNLERVIAAADPVNKMIVWAYAPDGNALTRSIGYAWQQDKWVDLRFGKGIVSLGSGAVPGISLEGLDAGYPDLDAMTISLDSPRFLGGKPIFAAFDSDYRLGFFDGQSLEATLDTADLSFAEGRRAKMRAFRPVTDAPTVFGQVGNKETWNDLFLVWGTERQASFRTGRVTINQAGWTHRIRVRIPAEQQWTGIAGIEAIESTLMGSR